MSGRGHYSNGVDIEHDVAIAVGAGKFPGTSFFNVNARRSNLSTTTPTVLVDFTDTYVFPSETGESMTIVSSNAVDVGNLMYIEGLDENKLYKTTTVSLNGTSPVDVGTWSRINAVSTLVKEVVGSVTVAGINTYAVVPPDIQRSSLGVHSTPDNTDSQVLSVIPSIIKTSGAAAYVDGKVSYRSARPGALGAFSAPFTYGLRTDGTSSTELRNTIPASVRGSVDYKIEAVSTHTNTSHYVRMAVLTQEFKE